jgi:lysozyme family protein
MNSLQPWQAALLQNIVAVEGGFVDDPADHGGATNMGITLKTLQSVAPEATVATLKGLTVRDAVAIYETLYAKPFLHITNQLLFNFLVNAAVQHGLTTTVMALQRIVRTKPDGVYGPATTAAVDYASKAVPEQVLAQLVVFRCDIYARMMRDERQRKFAGGWFNRLCEDLS